MDELLQYQIQLTEEHLWRAAESVGFVKGEEAISEFSQAIFNKVNTLPKDSFFKADETPRLQNAFALGVIYFGLRATKKRVNLGDVEMLILCNYSLGRIEGEGNIGKSKVSIEEITREVLSLQGTKAALAKHVKTYEKRQQVIEHWRAHIPPETSNEKAGEWLKDSFPDLAVRKLSEYVARAKKESKKIPPAGKA